jgi:hypothetical protein
MESKNIEVPLPEPDDLVNATDVWCKDTLIAYGDKRYQAGIAESAALVERLKKLLADAQQNLMAASITLTNDSSGAIQDTIWHTDYETLYDHLVNSAETISAALKGKSNG